MGVIASASSIVLWIPQAKSVWKNRHDHHYMSLLSTGTQWLLVTGSSAWGAYAFGMQAFWSGLPTAINLPLSLFTLTVIYKARREERILQTK